VIKNSLQIAWLLLVVLILPLAAVVAAETRGTAEEASSAEVLQAFTNQDAEESDIVTVDDKTKRIVMFAMGVPLLILLLATAALGVAMGIYGKPVFVVHMVCAGLSLCLAIAHAVAGIVWFYPF
jgi:hypothetical protein